MTDELKQQVESKLKGKFILKDIMNINHNPHPFILGTKHISFCIDNYSGMLGDACVNDKRFPTCSHPGCFNTYKEHTSDKVLFLQLTKNITSTQANKILKTLVDIMKQEQIDGISFVDTPEKFRIT